MKIKIQPKKLPKWIPLLKLWQLSALLLLVCLYVLPMNAYAADKNSSRKINLKVGDMLNYQLEKKVYQADDSSKWIIRYSFEVTGKKDSLYSMIGRFKLQTVASKNHYRDSRFSEESNFMPYLSVEKYPAVPFNLSENGIVQPITVPDSAIQRIIRENYPYDLTLASDVFINMKNVEKSLKETFQEFFIDWKTVGEGQRTKKIDGQIVQVNEYTPRNDSTVTITGTLDKNCKPQTFNCYIITNYIGRGEEFVVTKDLEPGKDFRLDIPLKWPIATNLSVGNFNTFSSFLLEPGDSVHLTVTPNGVEYSGPNALKSKLALAMRNNRLNIDTSWTEELAKQKVDNWISTEQKKIEPFRNQISGWAYNEMRCDIYYSAMDGLTSYYYYKNNRKVNEESFNKLFSNIKWDDYQSFSSMDMMRFIGSYLFRKLLIMKDVNYNTYDSETDKYYLAKITINSRIKYHALSQCVYEALKGNNLEEGRTLFNDYEKEYKGTGFYPFLKSKLENRAELGNGATVPEFVVKDINGKKISLSKMKGKYVQLLFVNLEYEDDTLELNAYQKLKEDLPRDKFEMITVFLNKNESLTKAYINRHHLKGIFVSDPDWQLEHLKKFSSEYSTPYYLVNPKGIIVFSGAGSPTEQFVKMIIEMINNDTYNEAEASVSKSTLYWVLSVSLLAIILTLVVVWFVTKAIKKREAIRCEQLELKLSAVRSQLNPHFLFNAMSSIQYLVNHDEKEKANLFLSKFAQLMRKVLLQSETERVPLSDELATIETYLELEALRHRFNYRIQVDDEIDLHNTEIPVMLLQPFVENSVIHGIAHLAEKGQIEINLEKKGPHHLQIRIKDNGAGYPENASANSGSNGKGMQITRKRVDLMMAKYGHEIDFKVTNRKELDVSLCGTEVVITFETEK